MSKNALRLVDVTDVLKHILATKMIGGIPRLIVTIIENRASIENLAFCIFLKKHNKFYIIGNERSIDVTLLDLHDFEESADNLDDWIEKFDPQLAEVDSQLLKGRLAHYFFLSSQWDTLPSEGGFEYLRKFVSENQVTFLHHDSYLIEREGGSPTAKRFAEYWHSANEAGGRILFISEHVASAFEKLFGKSEKGAVARYDFGLSYPRITKGVSPNAVGLASGSIPYLLVFSILDGRKSPVDLIKKLVSAGACNQYQVALIVRFVNDDKVQRMEFIDLVIKNSLKVFYAPNDATYLWLIKHAHTVYYPSTFEGFGMVPMDCKMFGKICVVPENADYAYLHNNVITYAEDEGVLPSSLRFVNTLNDLNSFRASKFVNLIFE